MFGFLVRNSYKMPKPSNISYGSIPLYSKMFFLILSEALFYGASTWKGVCCTIVVGATEHGVRQYISSMGSHSEIIRNVQPSKLMLCGEA